MMPDPATGAAARTATPLRGPAAGPVPGPRLEARRGPVPGAALSLRRVGRTGPFHEGWGGRGPSSAPYGGEHAGTGVGDRHLLAVAGRPVPHLDDTVGQPTSDRDDRRHAEQLGVLELHTRGDLRPVVVE